MIGIIIIGESATRANHSIYGYKRNTTPELKKIKDELFIFNDVISPAIITNNVLGRVFSFETLQDTNAKCSLNALARYAGYKTAFISRQYQHWGVMIHALHYCFRMQIKSFM